MATALISTTSTTSIGAGPQNWSDLPDGLLHSILLHLYLTRDLLAFSSVCRSWRSFAISTMAAFPTSIFPPLFIFSDTKYRSRRCRRIIPSSLLLWDSATSYQIACTKTFNQSPVEECILSIPFLSCSHGHLLFLTRCRQILVVNFITGFQITSPVLPFNHHPSSAYSRLALLTSPVSSPNCTLIFLTTDCLFLWKINSPDLISRPLRVRFTQLRQMIVVGSRIVVVALVGRRVWALELGNMLDLPQYLCPKELVVQCPTHEIFPCFEKAQFVDCEGEILYVCFTPSNETSNGETEYKVEVFRVDMFDDHMILVKMDDLGDRALFLSDGVNATGCVCNNPERWGGKNNSIYYARDDRWYRFEVGSFVSWCKVSHTKCFNSFWHYASILQ
ncbi:F-box domain containing protein [Rhynchospora pubera]|uniref:F-box domain containing protein n=1 Tax=Rhynchospora pubera TaxID=906938 RepID=A0AAV8EIB7_9POAL|nr:F-box domain containing protein [Rhynchospora pubera]